MGFINHLTNWGAPAYGNLYERARCSQQPSAGSLPKKRVLESLECGTVPHL